MDLQPRKKYRFGLMKVGDVKTIAIENGNRQDAIRALKAAHAYGARHGWVFFGVTEFVDGVPISLKIKRHA